MPYKYQVEAQAAGHYVLPRSGRMQADVHAFLSELLYDQTDEALWQQACKRLATTG